MSIDVPPESNESAEMKQVRIDFNTKANKLVNDVRAKRGDANAQILHEQISSLASAAKRKDGGQLMNATKTLRNRTNALSATIPDALEQIEAIEKLANRYAER